MTAVEKAVARGKAARKRGGRWEPVGVEYPGRLTAVLKGGRSGKETVKVQFVGGKWFETTQIGFDADGKAHVTFVREAEIKTRARAMIEPKTQDELDELIRETYAIHMNRPRAAANGNGDRKKLRRKR